MCIRDSGDVQVPDLLVVVEVGALDGVGGADAVSPVSYTHLDVYKRQL